MHGSLGREIVMGEDIVGGILQQVNTPGSDVVDLLQSYQAKAYDAFWQHDAEARLYCGFAKRLIGAGHPARAYEVVQDGIIYHQQNLELRYWAALALARGGNVGKATENADDLLRQPGLPPKLRVEVVSLKGRLKKDQYERTTDPALQGKLAAEAAALYERACPPGGGFLSGDQCRHDVAAGRPTGNGAPTGSQGDGAGHPGATGPRSRA